ncbi:Cysteine proteinase [Rhizoctonia solani]|uniref:Cysteine proteinase n=1 Tax=Rhizoctonia solani TaxID=456999 RepID=A0A8H7HB34_9AGAM|nr:Cysteine proteinase [Rhizoctonia solani]
MRQTNSTRDPPWRGQSRRPVPKGLARGERLSRSAFAIAATPEWGWVGTEVSAAEDIRPQHRTAACGFRKYICKNQHAPRTNPPNESGTEDDVVVISSDDAPECSIKSCKANPNCCNHLGQRTWENEAAARKLYLEAASLGEDPSTSARNPGLPVGLKVESGRNLLRKRISPGRNKLLSGGSTVNSFGLPRSGFKILLFELESPIYQLQVTFGALQHSKEKSFNPVKLVECLGIRAGEQQDAQEFSKLFMSHLDNEFKKQDNTLVQSLITDQVGRLASSAKNPPFDLLQFEGRQVYGTRCVTCQNASEHSSNFLEMEISLTSDCRLEERLKANLEDEKLDGDNRYDCSTCGSKQDAFRYLKLTHLPPVLHFSVLRFVFDATDFSRKKSKHAITFPHSINMRPFLSEEGTEIWYDLRGVLLHRGPSAYHGHYEAQVFDVTRGIWFQFNDEEVRELKIEDLVGKQTSGAPRSQASKDAYMLIYTQRNAPSPDASTLIMPKHAFDAVQRLNKEHTDSCDAYSQRKKEMESEFNLIREQKRQIYQTWQISDVDEVSMVLSKSSLEGWISKELDKATFSRPGYTVKEPSQPTSAIPSTRRSHSSPSPPPPDEIFRVQDASQDASEGRSPFNSTEAHVVDRILCVHGLLDPEASGNMKRIPMSAWKSIQKIGIDAHAIESNRICEDCTAALFNEKFYTIQHDDMVSRFDACMGRDRGTGKEWWISKSWLKDWRLKRPKMHVTGCRDPMPDVSRFRSDLYCEHDCLTPTQKFREKISTSALGILKEAFPEFQPPDTETEICTICEAVAANDKEATREARAKAEAERTRLMALYRREFFGGFKVTRLVEDWTYVILPLSFVTQWRAWLAKPLVAPRPGPITNDDFICEHGGLVIDLAEEKEVDGMICTASVSDWEVISELYGGGPYIECSLLKPDDHTGELRLQSNPPLCQDCRKTRLSNYDDAKINIYRLVDGEPLPDVNEAAKEPAQEKTQVTNSDVIHIDDTDAESPTLSDSSPPARAPGNRKRPKPVTTYAGQRRSKRIRTATTPKKGKTFFIHVNKDDTIRDVKRKIQDAEDIAPFYQQLYLHGVELIDDTRTLLQTGVLRTDCLVLRAIEAMDEDEAINWALTSGDVEPKTVRSRDEGRAFGGTLLGNTYVAPVGTTPSTEQCISATTATTAGTAITTSLPALNGTPGPSPTKGNDNTEDQDMLSVPSTVSDGNIDLDSRLAQELASEDTDPSFLFLEDDAGAAGISCASCTYLNHPGLKYCEMCETELAQEQ